MSHPSPLNPSTILEHIRSYLSARQSVPLDLQFNLNISTPKRTSSLYPFLEDVPKATQQDLFLTISARLTDAESLGLHADNVLKKAEEVQTAAATDANRYILVAALELHVYTLSKTDSTVIYVSKVDSTGYSPWVSRPASDTNHDGQLSNSKRMSERLPRIAFPKLAFKSLLSYFFHPETRPTRNVHAALFARSQNQYLFPNSILGGGKKVLGGTRLCRWWKACLEEVVQELAEAEKERFGHSQIPTDVVGQANGFNRPCVHLTYFLPGFDENEATGTLGRSTNTLPAESTHGWRYAPPFDGFGPSPLFPNAKNPDSVKGSVASEERLATVRPTLPHLIPSFSDDPKARFLMDLIHDKEEFQPGILTSQRTEREKGRSMSGHSVKDADNSRLTQPPHACLTSTHSETKDEATTPEKDMILPPDGVHSSSASEDPIEARPTKRRRLSSPAIDDERIEGTKPSAVEEARARKRSDERLIRRDDERILSHVKIEEFWERMGFRQECTTGDVTGFFVVSYVPPAASEGQASTVVIGQEDQKTSESLAVQESQSAASPSPENTLPPSSGSNHASEHSASTKDRYCIPHPVFSRLMSALLNHDFANFDLASESTQAYLASSRAVLVGEIGDDGWRNCQLNLPASEDALRKLKERLLMSDSSTGADGGSGGGSATTQEPVRVLQVRKKARKV